MIKQYLDNIETYMRTKVYKDLMEFSKSEYNACEIDTSNYKNVKSAKCSYCGSIKRYGFAISCIERDGKVFLVKNMKKG